MRGRPTRGSPGSCRPPRRARGVPRRQPAAGPLRRFPQSPRRPRRGRPRRASRGRHTRRPGGRPAGDRWAGATSRRRGPPGPGSPRGQRRRARRRWRSRRRSRRRAPPTARRTRRRRAPPPRPARSCRILVPGRPVTQELDLEGERDACLARDSGPHQLAEPPDVRGRAALVVEDPVGVLLGDHRAADPVALEAAAVDERASRRSLGRIPEGAAGAGDPKRLVGLAPAPDLVEPGADRRRVVGHQAERGPEDDLCGSFRRCVLEATLAVGQPEGRGCEARLGPVRPEDERGLEDRGDVRVMRPGVRPDRTTHVPRDREAELEARKARFSRHRRGLRHRQARIRHQAAVRDLVSLRPDVDQQPAHAGIRDHHVAAPAQEGVRHIPSAGQPDESPQLERVDGGRVEIGRAANAHRREPGERLVPGGPDPEAALDLGPEPDRVEGVAHRSAPPPGAPVPGAAPPPALVASPPALCDPTGPAPPAARRAISADGGYATRIAAASTSRATASAAPGLAPPRAAALMARCPTGSSSSRAAATSASASKSASSTTWAAPVAAYASALARWWPAACGYGTQTIGSPNAAASASVDEPARPTTRSAAASAAVISPARNGNGRYRSRRSGGSASRTASISAWPASPVTWSTQQRSPSRPSAPATAALKRRTACDPPTTRSRRGAAGIPSRSRAASRSIARGSRIGVPVT